MYIYIFIYYFLFAKVYFSIKFVGVFTHIIYEKNTIKLYLNVFMFQYCFEIYLIFSKYLLAEFMYLNIKIILRNFFLPPNIKSVNQSLYISLYI